MAKQGALIGDLSKQEGVIAASIMRMEQKIDRVRGVMVGLKGTSDMQQEFPKPMFEDHFSAPVHTIAPPVIHECDPKHFSNLHSFMGLAGFNQEVGSEENSPNVAKVYAQQSDNGMVTKLPLYDGTKNPYVHLGAYLHQLESMEHDDELKRKLFVKTLTGSALIWYIGQDTSKWNSWSDLVDAFINRYKSYGDHRTCNNSLKRKSVIEPISKKVLGNNLTEAQSKDMNDAKTPSHIPLPFNNQTIIPFHEPPVIIFEKLKSIGMLQPQRGEVFTPLPPHFDSSKHCAFHSNIPGHDTNECTTLRKEIQNLVESGKIVEVPKGKPQLMWCQPLTFMPTVEVSSQSVNPTSYQNPTNNTKNCSHKAPRQFTPIGEGSYASLYERLKDVGMVHPIKRKIYKEPWKADMKKSCVYHSGMLGHNIEKCFAFKEKIEGLIKSGQIKIENANDEAIADD